MTALGCLATGQHRNADRVRTSIATSQLIDSDHAVNTDVVLGHVPAAMAATGLWASILHPGRWLEMAAKH